MVKRIFIIHGWGGSPDEPLLRWLKSELEKNGFEVVVPKMPNSEKPEIETWVLKLKEMVEVPDKDTILVGHSVGCQVILRYLETLHPTSRVGGVVFIAPWLTLSNLESDEEWRVADPWLNTPIREAEVIVEHGKGHFTSDDGVEKLESFLNAILKIK